MDDLRTRAQLVASDHAGTVGTVLTRAEVDEAAAAEFPATLLLDLEAGEGEGTAHARLAVDWDRETVERVLASTDDDEIALWFDESELALAFEDADVEGHGFRQRAAVIAVAAAAVGATAGPAAARLPAANEGGGGGTPAAAAVTPAGAERGLQQDAQIAPTPTHDTGTAVASSSDGSTLSTGELAGAVAGGALLIAAAGFGATRRRMPPAQPA